MEDFKDFLICAKILPPVTEVEQEEKYQYMSRKDVLKIVLGIALEDKSLAVRKALGGLSAQTKKTTISDT